MKKHFKLTSLIWLLPFISFLSGYWLISTHYKTETIATPHLVGKLLPTTFALLTNLKINPRLIAQKEDADLPEGTIVHQTPQAGQKIKPHQSIFLVVSKKPQTITTPLLIQKTTPEITTLTRKLGIHHKSYTLMSNYPQESCFAQWPLPETPLNQPMIITYHSSGNIKPVIFPNLKELPLLEVLDFLHSASIDTEIIHHYPQPGNHTCDTCKVIDQRPLAGSIITLNKEKRLHVQLQV